MSHLEDRFARMWVEMYPGIDLHTEFKFHPTRRFKLDFVHLESKVAIEINGQIWSKGGHSSGTGLMRDYTKLNLAISLGWRVFQLSSEMITKEWLKLISAAIEGVEIEIPVTRKNRAKTTKKAIARS